MFKVSEADKSRDNYVRQHYALHHVYEEDDDPLNHVGHITAEGSTGQGDPIHAHADIRHAVAIIRWLSSACSNLTLMLGGYSRAWRIPVGFDRLRNQVIGTVLAGPTFAPIVHDGACFHDMIVPEDVFLESQVF